MTTPSTSRHRFIADHYDLETLRILCFDLGVNYDDLPGQALGGKTRELILQLVWQRQLDQLVT